MGRKWCRDKLMIYGDPQDPPEVQYDKFMKLAGPYSMSCVAMNDAESLTFFTEARRQGGSRPVADL